MAGPSKAAQVVRRAAQIDRDGERFFQRANQLAADPRVKFIFGRAAEEYGRALKLLEPLAKGKGNVRVPSIFPFKEYDRIECYVCGFEARADALPEVCPSCGAARYAFEREVSRESAWNLVARTTKEALAATRKIAKGVTRGEAKEAMAEAAGIRKRLLEEAKEERARAQ